MAPPFRETRRSRLLLAAVVVGWLGLTLTPNGPGLLDGWLYDALVSRALPPLPARPDVVAVEADEESLRQLQGGWPLDRRIYAALLGKLAEVLPAVVALDVWFPEPAASPASAVALEVSDALRELPALVDEAQALADALDVKAAALDSDRRLVEALSGVPTLLGVGQADVRADALQLEQGPKLAGVPGVERPEALAQRMASPSLSHPTLAEAVAGQASLVVTLGRGVVRRYP